jgi:hypothetical protein
MAVLWEGKAVPRVADILIPLPERPVRSRLAGRAEVTPGVHPLVDDLCDRIARFLSGEAIELPIDLLDRGRCTPFQWRVLMAEKAIPRGEPLPDRHPLPPRRAGRRLAGRVPGRAGNEAGAVGDGGGAL